MAFPVFSPKMLQGSHHHVFVRPCYEVFFELLLERSERKRAHITVMGGPGIGKSFFYAYCAFRFAKEPKLLSGRTLVVHELGTYFVFEAEDAGFGELSGREVGYLQQQPDVVRLVDGNSSSLLDWECTSIFFGSPGLERKYRHSLKGSPCEFVMLLWTFEKLSIAGTKFFGLDKEKLRVRNSTFGGVLRFEFAENGRPYEGFYVDFPDPELVLLGLLAPPEAFGAPCEWPSPAIFTNDNVGMLEMQLA